MFKTERSRARITNLNLRKEAAGEEEGAILAADIKMELTEAPAAILKQLAPGDEG